MTTRTLHGLRLRHADNVWITMSGIDHGNPRGETFTIGRVDGITHCDGPHPERWPEAGYCWGGEPHHYQQGWDIRPTPRGLPDDTYETMAEAWEVLARYLT
jgi:hypothetical protein